MTEVSSTRLYLGNLPRNGMLASTFTPVHRFHPESQDKIGKCKTKPPQDCLRLDILTARHPWIVLQANVTGD